LQIQSLPRSVDHRRDRQGPAFAIFLGDIYPLQSYCQELCMEAQAASCSTRMPSLKTVPCTTSGR
jgi:hypothetical protein